MAASELRSSFRYQPFLACLRFCAYGVPVFFFFFISFISASTRSTEPQLLPPSNDNLSFEGGSSCGSVLRVDAEIKERKKERKNQEPHTHKNVDKPEKVDSGRAQFRCCQFTVKKMYLQGPLCIKALCWLTVKSAPCYNRILHPDVQEERLHTIGGNKTHTQSPAPDVGHRSTRNVLSVS